MPDLGAKSSDVTIVVNAMSVLLLGKQNQQYPPGFLTTTLEVIISLLDVTFKQTY